MKVLFLSPHTDDAELGCGATIAKYLQAGHQVRVVAFTNCGRRELSREFLESMGKIGVEDHGLFMFKARRFCDDRQLILDLLIDIRQEFTPDIVFVPSGQDLHQDHQVVYNEAVRAFKNTTMFGYELPWNHLSFSPQHFEVIGKAHIEKKWQALKSYKSQKNRRYFSKDYIYGIATTRGVQIGRGYAESFDIIRQIQ